MTGETVSVRFKITNPGPNALALVLEPWGEIYEIIPGAKYEVIGEGPLVAEQLAYWRSKSLAISLLSLGRKSVWTLKT